MEISPIEFSEADKFHQLCLLGDGKGEGEVATGVESHLTVLFWSPLTHEKNIWLFNH